MFTRPVLEEELQRLAPPADPDLDREQELLRAFTRFWHAEPNQPSAASSSPSLFDHIWQDNGRIVAVKPRPSVRPYFKAIETTESCPETRGAESGATGVCPWFAPAQRRD